MNKSTLLFQLFTEGSLLGFFALCLSPTTFNFKTNFLGQTMSLDVSGLVRLSDSVIAVIEVATLLMLFVTIIFSMTVKEQKRQHPLAGYLKTAKKIAKRKNLAD